MNRQTKNQKPSSLRREFAKRWCDLFASSAFYAEMLWTYQRLAFLLVNQKKLQRMARKNQKTPFTFCEKAFGKEFLAVPKNLPKSKVQALWKTLPVMDACFGFDISTMSEADKKAMPKTFSSLMADQRGRKRMEIYKEAAVLAKQGKKVHEICIKLNPAYSNMSAFQRRAARDQMRSGIKRAIQKS